MNRQEINDEIDAIGRTPGVITCSLVDGGTGMIYHATGQRPDLEPLAEAACDYWRLHQRNDALYGGLGGLIGVVVLHEEGVINVLGCAAGTILVTLAERNRVVFSTWPDRLSRLRGLLEKANTSI